MKIKHRLRQCVAAGRVTSAVATACVAMLAPATSHATQTEADREWRDQMTSVLELMRHDARRAHEAAGMTAVRAVPAEPAAAPPAEDRLQLAALYGSAGALTAVVYVNGARKEYRPGATLPYGGAGSRREYRLERIVDTCVVLRKPGNRATRSVCYQPDAAPVPATPSPLPSAVALDAPLPGLHGRP